MITLSTATDQQQWNSFLASPAQPDGRSGRQPFHPFLQSWEMGEVYRDIGQEPVRLEVREGGDIVGLCFGHIVPAKRGRHLSVPYGPVVSEKQSADGQQILHALVTELVRIAKEAGCAFIRMSPFLPAEASAQAGWPPQGTKPSPLHLLAEHLWYLPLREPDPWEEPPPPTPPPCGGEGSPPSPGRRGMGLGGGGHQKTPEEIFASMRATTRNLIRRAEKEGVTITVSNDPLRDLTAFLTLHEETRRRHHFTPYTNAFFHAQMKHFSNPKSEVRSPKSPSCSLYLAHYKDEIIAASIHMHFAGETSYHHGASAQKYRNVPASYLLQWRAIQDAITRGDHIYNFWGIAPSQSDEKPMVPTDTTTGIGREFFCRKSSIRIHPEFPYRPAKKIPTNPQHPFAGVTLFKTGFSGKLLELQHCMDLPLRPTYYLTRTFEMLRKWRRGF